MTPGKKLWQTGDALNKEIENFTVGNDYLLDTQLLPFDIQASKAHVKMLVSVGVLSQKEGDDLYKELDNILALVEKGKFEITREQEDGHTAIEQYLVEKLGDTGKKIHTGRSRNDQVLVMMRLFMKTKLPKIVDQYKRLESIFRHVAEKNKNQIFPGYTHAQKAMPTTIDTWLTSFADALQDNSESFHPLVKILDQSPLGSASGFGIRNFKNNRTLSSQEMGFAKVQENPIYCGLSRGYFEYQFLQTFSPSLLLLLRFVTDTLMFTMSEFQYCSLPNSITTGSSIMPQKRNYDVFEIARGKIKQYFSLETQIRDICTGLISGYHRDLQLTKKPFLEAVALLEEILSVLSLSLENMEFHKENIQKAITPDLLATEKVYERVSRGIPFRDAYNQVKKEIL